MDSDAHSVASHPVPPTRIALDIDANHKLLPCSVTLTDPVEGAFCSTNAPWPPTSYDNASEMLPTLEPDVTTNCTVPCCPLAALARREEPEVQWEASQAVLPERADGEASTAPIADPESVMLTEPVIAKLERSVVEPSAAE